MREKIYFLTKFEREYYFQKKSRIDNRKSNFIFLLYFEKEWLSQNKTKIIEILPLWIVLTMQSLFTSLQINVSKQNYRNIKIQKKKQFRLW